MPATVHVVARFLAKSGREEAVKTALSTLVAPSRREIGCYQYDLLVNPKEPRDFCFVERWESDRALDEHSATEHVRKAIADVEELIDAPPDIRRYRLL